jgi:RNA polymerase sigma-70 factor (ECF subfamily)
MGRPMNTPLASQTLSTELEAHREFLWGVCYRMTGCAADADDLVQDTFERALAQPPADRARALRPWLVRVAMNRARDALRQRRRRGYKGPYLPSPIETHELPIADHGMAGPEARYGELESVSFAFLLALEALTPGQRAILLLRDVFDYSVEETAQALDQSASNVKTTHHRARRALEAYDVRRCIPTPERQRKTRAALEAFVACLAADDVPGLRALLSDDVCVLNDAGGEFLAAGRPVYGRDKVITMHRNLLQKQKHVPIASGMRIYNGLPALLLAYAPNEQRRAPKVVVQVDIDETGRITHIHGVLAERKLSAADFSSLATDQE